MVDMFDLKEKSIKAVVSVERYLHRTRHRVLGKLDKMVRRRKSWKVQLNAVILFLESRMCKNQFGLRHRMLLWIEGIDMEEVHN